VILQYLSESKNSVHGTSMLHSNETPFLNGKTKKRRPSPHLTGHEVYEMVKDVHIVLDKRKMTDNNIKKDNMWKKSRFF
jgi:hypothetical protein